MHFPDCDLRSDSNRRRSLRSRVPSRPLSVRGSTSERTRRGGASSSENTPNAHERARAGLGRDLLRVCSRDASGGSSRSRRESQPIGTRSREADRRHHVGRGEDECVQLRDEREQLPEHDAQPELRQRDGGGGAELHEGGRGGGSRGRERGPRSVRSGRSGGRPGAHALHKDGYSR